MPPPVTPTAATPLEGVFPYTSTSALSASSAGGDVRVRPIAKGGVELPSGMAVREAIVQLLGLRSQGHLFGAGLTKGARANGQG